MTAKQKTPVLNSSLALALSKEKKDNKHSSNKKDENFGLPCKSPTQPVSENKGVAPRKPTSLLLALSKTKEEAVSSVKPSSASHKLNPKSKPFTPQTKHNNQIQGHSDEKKVVDGRKNKQNQKYKNNKQNKKSNDKGKEINSNANQNNNKNKNKNNARKAKAVQQQPVAPSASEKVDPHRFEVPRISQQPENLGEVDITHSSPKPENPHRFEVPPISQQPEDRSKPEDIKNCNGNHVVTNGQQSKPVGTKITTHSRPRAINERLYIIGTPADKLDIKDQNPSADIKEMDFPGESEVSMAGGAEDLC